MYNSGGTIADALKRVARREYVLPAIQREFVWKPEQIERLFDSLMQGYPFGTFLFWRVEPATSGAFKFYDFVRDYHQKDAPHCPELGPMGGQALTAVLDGQQRLTALNIGLRGSMAVKQPNKWWTNPDAFPVRRLRLDLLAPAEPDEEGVAYRFKFLDDAQAAAGGGAHWFTVADILLTRDVTDLSDKLVDAGLAGDAYKTAFRTITRLHNIVHHRNLINYYEEEAQDIERVLNIFIRLNSGGTVLSYSDLLLSIATAQWKQVDARAEIHRLVDELNGTGARFGFSQDFVLKAGLMLADIASVGFKVANFTAANMAKLEADWPAIRAALVRTVELAASFGLNGQSLRADSALLPIAYYLHRRDAPANYVTSRRHAADREAVRGWLVRSLLKPSGIWGSGLDTLLTALRDAIAEDGADGFPAERLARVMAARGKGLSFEAAEIEDLLHVEYGDRRTFPLLSLLFPVVDLRNQFHVDHVFPISRFTPARLKLGGVTGEEAERLRRRADSLPNLQLLDGVANTEKRAALPAEWLGRHLPDPVPRRAYLDRHLLGEVPVDLAGFEEFHAARRDRLRGRLRDLLAVPAA